MDGLKNYTLLHYYKKTTRWGAWVRTPEADRIYLGTYPTQALAARAQDRAILKLNIQRMKLNFSEADYNEDEELRRTMGDDDFLQMLENESRQKYNTIEKSKCFQKFMLMEGIEDQVFEQHLAKQTADDCSNTENETDKEGLIETFLDQWCTPLLYPPPTSEIEEAAQTLVKFRQNSLSSTRPSMEIGFPRMRLRSSTKREANSGK